ncbi:MAG: hypothetical protein ACRDCZ_05605 [Culicoidibacterales bacterium]
MYTSYCIHFIGVDVPTVDVDGQAVTTQRTPTGVTLCVATTAINISW